MTDGVAKMMMTNNLGMEMDGNLCTNLLYDHRFAVLITSKSAACDNIMKNIGVLRDTARAPKPISQKHAIPCNGVIRYDKIPYHT